MNQLHIGEYASDQERHARQFYLPEDVLTHTVAILAKKRAGKTYTAGVLEEEFAARGLPFIVLDPVGVHYGLRSKADGKRSAYPVIVIGGEHGDVPIERKMGAQVAEAVVDENISCIIDLSELSKTAWREFTRDFCRELYRKNRNTTPRHVFIEEATEFIPQVRRPEMQEVYESVERLVRMGGNRGLGVTIISQRSAQVAKDVLSQLDVLIALRTVGSHDRKAMIDMFEDVLEEEDLPKAKEFKSSIAKLEDGEAWVWSPEYLKCFERVKIRERTTFHAGATVMGEVQLVQAKPDVSALRQRLAPPPEPKLTEAKPGAIATIKACNHVQEIDELHAANQTLTIERNAARQGIDEIDEKLRQANESNAVARQFQLAFGAFLQDFMPAYQVTGDGEGGMEVERIPTSIDKEEIIQEVLQRMPKNGVAVQVTPPDALRKRYLETTARRLYDRIAQLGPLPRQIMELLLGQDKFWPVTVISKSVTGQDGGGSYTNVKNAVKELLDTGLICKGGQGGGQYKATVGKLVEQELAPHGAKTDEVTLVVQHVLAKVAS